MKDNLLKIPQQRADEILSRYELPKELQEHLQPDMTPMAFLRVLNTEKEFHAIVTFMSHALPAREAIWWGCTCLGQLQQALPELQQKALQAARAWVQEPSEENRRIAERYAQRADLDNAAGWLAQATFWSGGSITPIEGPPSPAPDYLYSHAVAGAICLAAVLPDASKAEERYSLFIRMGVHIADGGNGTVD